MKTHKLLSAFALFGVGAYMPLAQGTPLTGTGYIDLAGDTAAPSPTPSSTAKGRFVWSPTTQTLFVGWAPANTPMVGDSVSLLGNANWRAVAIGGTAGETSTALGYGAYAPNYGIAIGSSAFATGAYAISIGTEQYWYGSEDSGYIDVVASGPYAIAVGMGAQAVSDSSVALGSTANGSGYRSVALGAWSVASGAQAVAINGTAVGAYSATIRGYAIGDQSFAGPSVATYACRSTAFGYMPNTRLRKNNSLVDPTLPDAEDPIFNIGNGTGSSPSDALTLYRNGTARFGGSIQIKSGTSYLTLQSAGTADRTVTLPDADGILLANTSTLDATKLTGVLPTASLPADTSRLGDTIELDSPETTGNLPWARIADKPTTLSGYLPTNTDGRITVPIRIEPQGDIPML